MQQFLLNPANLKTYLSLVSILKLDFYKGM